MMASTVLAGAEALIFQNINLKNLLLATVKGFQISMLTTPGFDPATAAPQIIKLLNRGGMAEIMGTTLLVFCAFCFAGIMSKAGCLDVVLQKS